MRMSSRRRTTGAAALSVLAAVLGLSLGGCKHATTETLASSITIVNSCGAEIDVYMDGALKSTVAVDGQGSIADVPTGSRLLEAKKKGTADLVYSQTLTITAGTNTTFTVSGQAVLRITNNFPDILKIYANATYTGDIGPGLTQSISRVKFGTYAMLAFKRADLTEVASTTIEVTQVQTYDWVINP
jgi:hypothetical protein